LGWWLNRLLSSSLLHALSPLSTSTVTKNSEVVKE
jgi:hypothetical protein